jgi:hypothetical protein
MSPSYMHGPFGSALGFGAMAPIFGLSGTLFGIVFAAVLLWTIVLKGFSLWYAARGSQKWWFIALLVVNTFGILEIIYLLAFRPKDGTVATPIPAPLTKTASSHTDTSLAASDTTLPVAESSPAE